MHITFMIKILNINNLISFILDIFNYGTGRKEGVQLQRITKESDGGYE